MLTMVKAGLVLAAGIAGAAVLCPLCDGAVRAAAAQDALVQARDTATVRIHISGMVCGTCPTTARLALKQLEGVYSATVTLDDSLGVVRYDPKRVTPQQIAEHLTKQTGFDGTILPESPKRSRQ